jgi:serine kinase of HPr protein (carbohydrate metabolism regulator)
MFGRILNKLLSRHKGFILHASCAEINGKAYVFSGKSGSGKSTIAKMLDNKFRFFSDETVIVRKMGKRFYLFQSPFMENAKNHLKSSKKLMIEKFFLIEKSSLTQVKKIKDKKLVLKHLFTERRAEKKYYKRQVETIIDFVENNQFYKLKFTKDKKSLNKILEDLSAASPTAGTAPHTSTATSTA